MDKQNMKNQPQAEGPKRKGMAQGVDPKKALKSLSGDGMKYVIDLVLKKYGVLLCIVIICIVTAAVCNVKGTLFIQSLIDDYITPLLGVDNPDFNPLVQALVNVAIIYLIGIITTYIYNRIMVNVGQGSLREIRSRLFNHMESLPLKYFDQHQHGDIMSIYTNDTDTLRQFIGSSFPQLINSLVTIISTFVSMMILSVPLTLMATVFVLIIVFISGKLAQKSGKYYVAQQVNLGAVNGYIEEMMTGQKVIKVFTREEKSIDEFNELNNALKDSATEANSIANILMPVSGQLNNLSYVIVSIVGATFALKGYFGLSIGMLISFMTLLRTFGRPFTMISMEINSIISAGAGASRIYNLLTAEPESDEGREVIESNGVSGDIVFNNVDFSYVPEKQVLYDINMYANKGQKIALVGSTGAGKTTIANLINRFYDIQNGSIEYDHINIQNIRKASLRNNIGVVLQDVNLFTDTVMENIRYGRLDATDEECIAAARLANADGFIRRLPDGYNTKLSGNGSNLSQGQRQLISIARVAVADPPVLILDEATSSIDTRTEILVQKGMDSLMHGRTTFVIAHRLSTVKNSDCIMVLENGKIIERGSHDSLIEEKGRYYQLYTGNLA